MTCLCAFCRFDRQFLLVRNYGSMREKQAMMDELYERMYNAECDNERWEAIRSGQWPNARQIAEDIMRRTGKTFCDSGM